MRFDSYRQLPSFTAWLLQHGRHLRSLDLNCQITSSDVEVYAWELAGCLMAWASTGGEALQQLSLRFFGRGTALCVTSWCPALRQLRSLDLSGLGGPLRINSDLAGLTAVTRLCMYGDAVAVQPQVQLPPRVERLSLHDDDSTVLPPQVRLV